jgi:hypothetical protein
MIKNYNEKFKTDLKQGEAGEWVIARFLLQKGYKILDMNKTMDYDIKITDGLFDRTIEVKTDRYEYMKGVKTDNMFLEVSCNDKMSGIRGSKADYFIYYYPDWELAYLISMNKIRKIANYGRRSNQSGDKNKVTGYLINRFEFENEFKIIKIKKDKFWDNLEESEDF